MREARSLRDELGALILLLPAPQLAPAVPGGEHRPAPGLAPPGSAVVLPSQPAMTAAGLGPRPSSRPGAKATLLGIHPPLTVPPLRAPDAEDDDRASDDELTRVGERPPASALAVTLASMTAVAPPSAGKRGTS